MGETRDGGPAFPRDGHPDKNDLPHEGMSLRDWFAGQALAGWTETQHGIAADIHRRAHGPYGPVTYGPEGMARAAYAIADAMLAERAATKGA